ncbi:MAG TPA: hypothetical protein VK509_18345 [Polyangiales bacterium]|nr:hypothetical protein [Polyangiales bacterium]
MGPSWPWMLMLAAGVGFYLFKLRTRRAADATDPGSRPATAGAQDEQRRLLPAELAALYDAASAQGDLRQLSARLISGRGNWDERGRLIEAIAPRLHRSTLDAWCSNEASSQLPFLLRGAQGIAWAWEARGSGQADEVSAQAFALFQQRLKLAETDLQRAAALDPKDPTPWALLIWIARGLEQSINHTGDLYREACERDAQNAIAHRHMLTMLSAKWHGSHDAMLDFARAAAQIAPEGSDMPALVLRAHVERWFYSSMIEDNDAEADAYLKDPQVRVECENAWARSLGSLALRARPSTILLRNDAAFWFWLVKDAARLKQETQQIGNAHTDMFWSALGQDADVFTEAKKWAQTTRA